MANITTFQDVSSARKRPIPVEDKEWVESLIDEAEATLAIRRGDLDEWVAETDTEKRTANVKKAVRRMVLRVVKNPDGFTTEAAGDYSYGRDKSQASGEIYASTADLQLIGIKTGRKRAGSMRLTLPADSPRNMSAEC
jgi:hypothetical protein